MYVIDLKENSFPAQSAKVSWLRIRLRSSLSALSITLPIPGTNLDARSAELKSQILFKNFHIKKFFSVQENFFMNTCNQTSFNT